MTQGNNPLRQLATAIAQECQTVDHAKRVKQSTILNVLSKHAGQHSIQVGDVSPTPKRAPATPRDNQATFLVVQARVKLYDSYPKSDLLAVDIERESQEPIGYIPEDCGDSVFRHLWEVVTNVALNGAFIDVELKRIVSLIDDLGLAIETNNDDAIDKAIRRFPERLAHFFEREKIEALDGLDKESDPENYYENMHHYLVFRTRFELQDVREAFIKSPLFNTYE